MDVCYDFFMEPNDRAKAVLSRIEYATLATVDTQGNPWNAPVYVAFDNKYNFYWGSHTKSQHSKNILTSGKIFLAIYNSTALPGTGEGVYIKARCNEITNSDEIELAHTLIQKRREPIPYWGLDKILTTNSPVKLYKAVPNMIWMNGDTTINATYVDIRVDAGA